MNRQIKFRGKRLDLNIWMYGDLLQYNEGSVAIGTHGRYTDDGYSFNDCWNETPYVDEDTLGQFTGLLDRNGKEIYEGDIVKITDSLFHIENISPVIFKDGAFGILTKYLNKFHPLCLTEEMYNDGKWSDKMEYSYEVIGNIHDNPELLTSTKP